MAIRTVAQEPALWSVWRALCEHTPVGWDWGNVQSMSFNSATACTPSISKADTLRFYLLMIRMERVVRRKKR